MATLDPPSNSNVLAAVDFASGTDAAHAVAVQDDGKVVAAGTTVLGGQLEPGHLRYNANGTLDTSFGTGKVTASRSRRVRDERVGPELRDGKGGGRGTRMRVAGSPFAHLESALNHQRAGRLADAEAGYLAVLADTPCDADARHLLGLLRQRQGRHDEAAGLLAEAARLDPAAPHFHANLGVCLARLGRAADAERHLRQALDLRPAYLLAWRNLALLLERHGRWAEAADAYRQLTCIGDRERRAAEDRPIGDAGEAADGPPGPEGGADPEGGRARFLDWVRYGLAARHAGRPGEAAYALTRAVALDKVDPGAWHALASARGDLGQYTEAAECFAKAADLDPGNPFVASDAVHLLHYDPARTPADRLAAARAWAARHAEPLTAAAAPHPPPEVSEAGPGGAGRRLRVGFVSADFREHPIGRLAGPVLAFLDQGRFAIACYDDAKHHAEDAGGGGAGPRLDAVARHLRGIPGVTWRCVGRMTDDELDAQVRHDKIDILIDWAGHMAGHRLRVFARKPAPVQATHFNYPATTGMTAMDWRLTDDLAEPAGVPPEHGGPYEAHSVERPARLGSCGWVYHPGDDVPDVGPPPALANGHVTFCSLNKPLKHSDPTAAVWARVLAAVPASKLLLLGFGDERQDVLLFERFARYGVRRAQVQFVPRLARAGYLAQYNRADIALDPFPYNGGITTCDAMLMGLPLVALEGRAYAERQGLMLLTNVGLPELVAKTADEYVAIAANLAADLPRLAALRRQMRGRLADSKMADGRDFAARLGAAFEAMWAARAGGHVPSATAPAGGGDDMAPDSRAPRQGLALPTPPSM